MGRERTTEGTLVVYGANAVQGLLASDMPVTRLVVSGRVGDRHAALARQRGLRCEEVDRSTLDRLAGTPQHQGVVATTAPYRYVALEDVVAVGRAILLLDSVQDPRNLGAILRTARAAGVGGVAVGVRLSHDRCHPIQAAWRCGQSRG